MRADRNSSTVRFPPPNEYHPRFHGRLVSVSRRVPGLTPAQFLRNAAGHERFFWRDGRSDLTLAGMGAAADLMGWGETRTRAIERQAKALFASAVVIGADHAAAAPRLFGGFAFREDFVPDITWTGFNPAHFILPHIQLVYQNDTSWMTINALVPENEEPEASLPQLQEALDAWFGELTAEPQQRGSEASVESEISYPMDVRTWTEMLNQAIDRIRTTPLEKVVLSRVCEVKQSAPVDIDAALCGLLERYPECYTFLFEPKPNHAFLGATPELLVQVEGETFRSMGLAGSVQRGENEREDQRYAQALLDSRKDRHEHDLVVRALRERLAPIAAQLEIPDHPQVYRLSNIQHLYTPVNGRLHTPAGVIPLIDILHPTPALGGTPRDLALPFIRDIEPVPRGWYAAPVGWIDQRLDGSFAVAIRSAVIQNRRAWLYAGAGIVADSVPELEWEETGWKFRPMQDALGVTIDVSAQS